MKIVIALGLAAGLAACSHAQPVPEATTKAEPAPAPVAPPPVAPAQPIAKAVPTPAPVAVPTDSVYFDFDKSDLKPPSENFLAKLGTLLAEHPDLKLRIEGNCDERGTEEYNLALGERRADAAKNYLVNMGAREGQITTLSYGRDRPRAKGHNEEAWRQNRRDDFIPDRTTVPAQPMSANP